MSQAAISPGGPFAYLLFDDDPLVDSGRSSESDSWLMSYLDMLMLLITLQRGLWSQQCNFYIAK